MFNSKIIGVGKYLPKNVVSNADLEKNLDTSNFIPSFFILAFLLVGFIPNIEAVDKISPQWLYLSFINLFCGAYLLYKREFFQECVHTRCMRCALCSMKDTF